MTTISIAMATYKGGPYITEQLESIARQTVLPMEVVITDDNSPDDTLARVAEFAARAPFPVRYEKNEKQLGYRANFMKAANLCKGDLIAFCDQDDVWLPHKLEKCLAQFANEDVLLMYHGATVVNNKLEAINSTKRLTPPKLLNPPQSLEPLSFAWGLTIIFRKFLLTFSEEWPLSANVCYDYAREAHDQWFCFLGNTLGTTAYEPEELVLYRQHDKNTYGWKHDSKIKEYWKKFMYLNANTLEGYAACAICRIAVLNKSLARLEAPYKQRAMSAIRGYSQLKKNYKARIEILNAHVFTEKIRLLFVLIFDGAYKSKTRWGVGKKAFFRDAIYCFFM